MAPSTMGLHLRNTLTRQVEPIEPIEPGRVGIYTCGPTVYRWAHVGNLRTYLLADLIRRALLYHGLTVFHVKNITDVGHLRDERFDRGEDRMLVQAQLESKSSAEIATAYEAGFHHDEALVNILAAHVYPRATEHIPEMVTLAERLQDAGHAYATEAGNVYYAVASFPGYGRLSGNTLDQLRAGHRVEVEPDKRDPADFALWKPAGEGRQLKWPTARWGDGFPGWHLECSAMGLRYLGPAFDIHTGGVDNIFPHHEDEIAQSAALSGRPPARYWVHGEHLLAEGRKMAKSAGNFQRITELAADGSDPLAFRYLAMTVHYSRKQNLSDASITGARVALASLRARLRALGPPPSAGPWTAPAILRAGAAGARPAGIAAGVTGHGSGPDPGPADYPVTDRATAAGPGVPAGGSPAGVTLSPAGAELHLRFVAAVDDDLDLPRAIAVVREMLKAPLSPDERRWLVLDADAILGLDLDRVWASVAPGPAVDRGGGTEFPAEVRRLLGERAAARAARNFARADELRAELLALAIEVIDRPAGTTARRIDG
jgi:cysteinyl-tRNA synthetase